MIMHVHATECEIQGLQISTQPAVCHRICNPGAPRSLVEQQYATEPSIIAPRSQSYQQHGTEPVMQSPKILRNTAALLS